jgi:hypothetical protein
MSSPGKGVVELEATALFIANREGIDDEDERAERLVELKPHVLLPEARFASEQVNRLIERSHRLGLREEPQEA